MAPRPTFELEIGHRKVRLGERTLIMGTLNVTPDSFSDGGLYLDPATAIGRGLELVRQGADWIDVGGESTRPGSQPVSAQEESRRVLPVIRSR
jgi:dihydropteroate synthase